MIEKSRTKGYYLPKEVIEWLAARAAAEKRSVSNFLAVIIEEAKRNGR